MAHQISTSFERTLLHRSSRYGSWRTVTILGAALVNYVWNIAEKSWASAAMSSHNTNGRSLISELQWKHLSFYKHWVCTSGFCAVWAPMFMFAVSMNDSTPNFIMQLQKHLCPNWRGITFCELALSGNRSTDFSMWCSLQCDEEELVVRCHYDLWCSRPDP